MSEEEKQSNIVSGLPEILKDAMKSKNYNVDRIASESGISERHVELILGGQWEKLPPSPYLHGYIVTVAEMLDLDGEKLWKEHFGKDGEIEKSGEFDRLPENRFKTPTINKRVLTAIIIFTVILGYFIVRTVFAFNITDELSIDGLNENPTIVNEPELEIEGSVSAPTYNLSINQDRIYPNENGDFTKVVELEPGFNTLIFDIKGTLDKEGQIIKQVFYKTNNKQQNDNFDNLSK